MSTDVTVLRVFTDSDGKFGNPLGVVDAASVAPADRQRIATELGYSETIFVELPEPGAHTAHARIFTPATELPFAGHPTVGASWWLRNRGMPIHTLQVAAGVVAVNYDNGITAVRARAGWAPEFEIQQLDSPDDVLNAHAADYFDDFQHYIWAWLDESEGKIRSRTFAAGLGVPEDEATGAAAVRITDMLSRDLTIVQGKGSIIHTSWSAEGWVRVAGRVADDGVIRLD